MTPEERAAERYPQPTAHIPTAYGWKTLNHRADGYAACIREVVEPLEARVRELEEALSMAPGVRSHNENGAPIYYEGICTDTIGCGCKQSQEIANIRAILNKKP